MDWKRIVMEDILGGTKAEVYEVKQKIANVRGGVVTAQVFPYKDGPDWYAQIMWGTRTEPEGQTTMRFDEHFKTLDEAKAYCEYVIKQGPPAK